MAEIILYILQHLSYKDYPISQNRVVLLELGIQLLVKKSFPRARQNFQKANWKKFPVKLVARLIRIPPTRSNQSRYVGQILECIPIMHARLSRSCPDQVLNLTIFIAAGFQMCLKSSVVFIDLIAVYDIVQGERLIKKFFKVLPFKALAHLLINLLSDASFQTNIGEGNSKQRILINHSARYCSSSFTSRTYLKQKAR